MKVRLKQIAAVQNSTQYELLETSERYYICRAPGGGPVAFEKAECEPLEKETEWQDVTGECEAKQAPYSPAYLDIIWSYLFFNNEQKPDARLECFKHTYRLRKVQVMECPDPVKQPVTFDMTAACPRIWAFLVERRVND